MAVVDWGFLGGKLRAANRGFSAANRNPPAGEGAGSADSPLDCCWYNRIRPRPTSLVLARDAAPCRARFASDLNATYDCLERTEFGKTYGFWHACGPIESQGTQFARVIVSLAANSIPTGSGDFHEQSLALPLDRKTRGQHARRMALGWRGRRGDGRGRTYCRRHQWDDSLFDPRFGVWVDRGRCDRNIGRGGRIGSRSGRRGAD